MTGMRASQPRNARNLATGLGAPDPASRARAACDSRAVQGLLPALKDPDSGVRRQAAWAIGVLGK